MNSEKVVNVNVAREGSLYPKEVPIIIKEGTTAGEILSQLGLHGYRLSYYFCFLDNSVDVFQLLSTDGAMLFASVSPYTVLEKKHEQARAMVLAR